MQKYYYEKSNVLDAIIIGSNTIFYCLSAIYDIKQKTKISLKNSLKPFDCNTFSII